MINRWTRFGNTAKNALSNATTPVAVVVVIEKITKEVESLGIDANRHHGKKASINLCKEDYFSHSSTMFEIGPRNKRRPTRTFSEPNPFDEGDMVEIKFEKKMEAKEGEINEVNE